MENSATFPFLEAPQSQYEYLYFRADDNQGSLVFGTAMPFYGVVDEDVVGLS